ncbi:MAG TPA: KGG domain-containing protein [Polyangiaceae bacterium]|nr:KGG domain-containing protein [Polyangiaceae bacterium]
MSSRRRGFASMNPEKQREIASKGGKAAHAKGTAHEFTPEEARIAGRKGGQAAHAKGTAHEFTPEEARVAGRKGGQAAHEKGTAHQFTSEEARAAGRKGGQVSQVGARESSAPPPSVPFDVERAQARSGSREEHGEADGELRSE